MYDGTRFKGWQDQDDPKQRTIQGTIGNEFAKRFGISMRVTGASRTDMGVHSHGQAIHFDTPMIIDDTKHFEYYMNRLLPHDIKIYNTTIAPPGNPDQVLINEPWHATKSANGKLYSYRFCVNKFVDPMRRNYCAHVYFPINIDRLHDILQHFVGTHDFKAFSNRVQQSIREFETKNLDYSTVKTINSIQLVDEGGGYYRVDYKIESALYRMIRNIMGTALEVASDRYSEEWLLHLLQNAPSRNDNKSKAAPSQGLCLEHVYYDHF